MIQNGSGFFTVSLSGNSPNDVVEYRHDQRSSKVKVTVDLGYCIRGCMYLSIHYYCIGGTHLSMSLYWKDASLNTQDYCIRDMHL